VTRAALIALEQDALSCVACRLAESRTKVVFCAGDDMAPLMFIGEGPGREEDLAGEAFVGRSGRLLEQLAMEELGRTRADFYIANVVKCRPPANRDPKEDEVAACSRYLDGQLEVVAPRVVITLGNFATRALLQTSDGITKLRGRTYPFRSGVLVPTFHPAAALRGGGVVVAQMRADLVRAKVALESPAAPPPHPG
jgi:DNA polymerase